MFRLFVPSFRFDVAVPIKKDRGLGFSGFRRFRLGQLWGRFLFIIGKCYSLNWVPLLCVRSDWIVTRLRRDSIVFNSLWFFCVQSWSSVIVIYKFWMVFCFVSGLLFRGFWWRAKIEELWFVSSIKMNIQEKEWKKIRTFGHFVWRTKSFAIKIQLGVYCALSFLLNLFFSSSYFVYLYCLVNIVFCCWCGLEI